MIAKNTWILGSAVVAMLFTSCGDEQKPTEVAATITTGDLTLRIDTVQSTVNWKGEMVGMYSHNGTIQVTNGTVMLKDGVVNGGNFTVDMHSITPLDDGFDEKEHTKANLIGHLSSADFFDVATYPLATFAITGGTGNTATGNLTLRGVTNPETVKNITISEAGGIVKVTGDLVIDRKKYGAKFDMPVQDMVLSNDIVLNVALSATR